VICLFNDVAIISANELKRAKKKYSSQVWPSGNRMGSMQFPDKKERKAKTLCAVQITADRSTNHVKDNFGIRKLTPVECERLQTLPDNYTKGVSNTQRYKMLGNGWTVDVITYILKHL
jgi:site-specific DNA-cytosine methylase